MILWWIGDVVLFVVVIPVVLVLLGRVFRAVRDIGSAVGRLAEAGPVLVSDVEAIPQLARTEQLVHETSSGVARYGAALTEIL